MRNPPACAAIVLLAVLSACSDAPAGPELGPGADNQAVVDVAASAHGPIVPFADLEVFFEFNSTDNDLGLQVVLDAEAWDRIAASGPGRPNLLQILARKELGELGLTELRFESAEPSPAGVLAMFPPGVYDFTGHTVEGGRLTGSDVLSHQLAPAPVFTPNDGDVVDPANTVIAWAAVPGVARYEVIVSNEDNGLSMEVELGPGATSLSVPVEFMEPDSEYKAEVLAILPNGNKTITEHVFTTSS